MTEKGRYKKRFGNGGGKYSKARHKKGQKPAYTYVCSRSWKTFKITIRRKIVQPMKLIVNEKRNIENSKYTMTRTCDKGLKFKFNQVEEIQSTNQIINVELLQIHVTNRTLHAYQCSKSMSLAANGESPIKLVTEVQSYMG